MSQTAVGVRGRWTRSGVLVAVLLFGASAFVACSDDSDEPSAEAGLDSTTTTLTQDSTANAAAETSQLVAQSTGQVEVWSAPEDEDATSQMLSASSELNGILTFLVVGRVGDDWLEVQLPTAPVGSKGFVRVADITLTRHRFRIEIARAARTMKVFVGNAEAISGPVSFGPDAPPAGTTTFVKELLIPSSGESPYGRHVYGLAGWVVSEAQVNAGPGVVAIHTVASDQLGQDLATGAIGTDQQTITQMVDTVGLPLGTPVVITA